MNFKNMVWGVAAFAVIGASLTGCNGGSGETASGTTGTTGAAGGTTDGAKKKDFKIVMIAKSQSNPVFTSAKKGAEDAAAELGKANDMNITVDWRTPNDEDAQIQAQRVEAAVSQSMARSDEQLAYYVGQAREVIDLSLTSQKAMVEDLRRLQGQLAPGAGA